jgi:hypothetical protein
VLGGLLVLGLTLVSPLNMAIGRGIAEDGEASREIIRDDIVVAQRIVDWAREQAVALEHAGSTGPLTLPHMPRGTIYASDAGVWLSAKAGGVTSLSSHGRTKLA